MMEEMTGTVNTFGRFSPSIIYNYIKVIPIHSLRQIRALSEGEQTFSPWNNCSCSKAGKRQHMIYNHWLAVNASYHCFRALTHTGWWCHSMMEYYRLIHFTWSYRSNRGKIGGSGCEQEEQSHGEHPQQWPKYNSYVAYSGIIGEHSILLIGV